MEILKVEAGTVPDYGALNIELDTKSNTFEVRELPNITCDTTSFEVLSTIRYDPLITKSKTELPEKLTTKMFFLWEIHMKRLQVTLDFFHNFKLDSESNEETKGRKKDVSKEDDSVEVDGKIIFESIRDAFMKGNVLTANPLKVRLLVTIDGDVKVELHETPVRPNLFIGLSENYPKELIYDLYVDMTSVFPSPFTSFKTTKRDVYNRARKRCLPGKSALEEVLLINSSDEVMEGLIFNVAVELKDGSFATPPLSSGCLCGVTRHMLLAKGLIFEDKIHVSELLVGHEVLLFNGIVGVAKGIIRGFVEPEDQ